MNRICNWIEPKVIDDELLKQAVSDQGPQDEAGQLARQEGILFKDVLSLRLDFQSEYGKGWERTRAIIWPQNSGIHKLRPTQP